MAKNKIKSPALKAAQKARTRRNKIKKYKKLLEENPNSPHKEIWESQIRFNS